MSDEEKYQNISTKVSPYVKKRIQLICKKRGMTEYDLLQMMCDCIVRYMDDRHNLSDEMEQTMNIFEHLVGWKDAFNLADPVTEKEVAEAIYILQDPEGKHTGFRAVMVQKPYFNLWTQTANVQQIVERVIEVCIPDYYKKLRMMLAESDCNNIFELLCKSVRESQPNEIDKEIREEFEDCNRHEYGKRIEYGQRTKRKKHRGMEIYDRAEQKTIEFEPDDLPNIPTDNICNEHE